MPDPVDPLDEAVREFCFGNGRAVPPSVFYGRVVGPDDPMWTDEDRLAAVEWVVLQRTLCPGGCGQPRQESFDIASDNRYDVTTLQCHACAARDRRAYNLARSREPEQDPQFGLFHIVKPEAPSEDADA